jgi:YD repeat-containing protein
VLPCDLLGAETAAHVLRDDAHALLRKLQPGGDFLAYRKDALGRLVEHQRVALPGRGAAVRLQRVVQRRLRGVSLVDHDVGFAQTPFHVAADLNHRLAALAVVQPGREWQRLVVDANQTQRILGDLFGHGRDRGNLVADEAHRAIEEAAVSVPLDLGRVRTREHGVHAGQRFGARSVDARDARMRQRASQYARVELPLEPDVAGILRAAADLVRSFDAGHRRPATRRAARTILR